MYCGAEPASSSGEKKRAKLRRGGGRGGYRRPFRTMFDSNSRFNSQICFCRHSTTLALLYFRSFPIWRPVSVYLSVSLLRHGSYMSGGGASQNCPGGWNSAASWNYHNVPNINHLKHTEFYFHSFFFAQNNPPSLQLVQTLRTSMVRNQDKSICFFYFQ